MFRVPWDIRRHNELALRHLHPLVWAEGNGAWWPSRSSKPAGGQSASGRFDSYSPPSVLRRRIPRQDAVFHDVAEGRIALRAYLLPILPEESGCRRLPRPLANPMPGDIPPGVDDDPSQREQEHVTLPLKGFVYEPGRE